MIKAAELKLVSEQTIEFSGRPIAASPDGTRVASVDDRAKVCITTLAEPGSSRCGSESKAIDTSSLRWSADSRYVVYTENFVQALFEPDIHVVEVATGKEINLTEDNVEGSVARTETSEAALDAFPAFTLDSQEIVFWRFDRDAGQARLLKIPVEGGDAVRLKYDLSFEITDVAAPVTFTKNSMIFTRRSEKNAGSIDLYSADVDGKDPKLLAAADAEKGALVAWSVSPALNMAIVAYSDVLGRRGPSEDAIFAMDTVTGVMTPLTIAGAYIANAAFSPTGEQLVLVGVPQRGGAGDNSGRFVVVRDGINGVDSQIVDKTDLNAFFDRTGNGLQWVAGNKIIVGHRLQSFTIYTLG
jgi:Tol biopolymer transport system component